MSYLRALRLVQDGAVRGLAGASGPRAVRVKEQPARGAAEPGLAVPATVSTRANASVIRLRTCWLVR
jgi:hypothetical protein